MHLRNTLWLSAVVILLGALSSAHADVPTTINVQGILLDSGGDPVTVMSNVTFTIYDAATEGTSKWSNTRSITPDDQGRFNVTLGELSPIPETVFDDPDRWLGIQVELDPEMDPRMKLTSLGYAYRALDSDTAAVSKFAATSSVNSTAIIDGTILFSDIASNSAGEGQVMKRVGGNWVASTDETGGWTDDGSVVRLINLSDRVGIGTSSPSTNLEVDGNAVVTGKITVGPNHTNTGTYGIAVGSDNVNGGWAGFAAGYQNTTSDYYTAVTGGQGNKATDRWAVVSGGYENEAGGRGASVGGGLHNYARGEFSVIAGGGGINDSDSNLVSGEKSAIGGGHGNNVGGTASGVFCGSSNLVSGHRSFIGGGQSNSIPSGGYSSIAGGVMNEVIGFGACVGGGGNNVARGDYAVVAGGGGVSASDSNAALGNNSAVGGGHRCVASGTRSVVAGGGFNDATNEHAAVGGGGWNNASGLFSVVSGGNSNNAAGDHSMVPGGMHNSAYGNWSFAAGRRASALHHGAFVWGDSTDHSFTSTAANQFLIRAGGGVGIGTDSPAYELDVNGDIQCVALHETSDARFKSNITSITDALTKVGQLRGVVHTWNRDEYPGRHFDDNAHLGFLAQEIQEVVPEVVAVDNDGYLAVDYTHLTPLLVEAIKELKTQNESKDERIDQLEAELADVRTILEKMLSK
jgi:hypothetical protein